MKYLLFPAAALCAYFLSGVNPAIVLSRLIYKQDIRQQGSGNPGFTNFMRVYGGKWAWFVFFLDIGKSVALLAVFGALFGAQLELRQLGVAFTTLFAMLGHAYPVWYRFKGGKGFLIAMTSVFFLDWRAGLIALAIMLVLLFATHYMSLATMLAVFSAPISLIFLGTDSPWTLVLCSLCVLFMLWRHRANIVRLCKGTENKFHFHKEPV